MSIVVTGKVWKFGDNITTDYMAPSFSQYSDWEEAKKTILHIHPQFPAGHRPGDVIVGGSNFGCGSSRETAPVNLKKLGIGCVVAESFGRIFFRNSITIAFPVLACPGVSAMFEEGDRLELDFDRSLVRNLTRGTERRGNPLPPQLIQIVQSGGLLALLKAEGQAAAR
ncbi:MAG: 3-isopropylmalate dehydratase [Candidatus Lambdaproteobacteria bacterium]|nr:3-isopropylmalate dehydratase [Candidatus Lambdaproteobacteria bacterium]